MYCSSSFLFCAIYTEAKENVGLTVNGWCEVGEREEVVELGELRRPVDRSHVEALRDRRHGRLRRALAPSGLPIGRRRRRRRRLARLVGPGLPGTCVRGRHGRGSGALGLSEPCCARHDVQEPPHVQYGLVFLRVILCARTLHRTTKDSSHKKLH